MGVNAQLQVQWLSRLFRDLFQSSGGWRRGLAGRTVRCAVRTSELTARTVYLLDPGPPSAWVRRSRRAVPAITPGELSFTLSSRAAAYYNSATAVESESWRPRRPVRPDPASGVGLGAFLPEPDSELSVRVSRLALGSTRTIGRSIVFSRASCETRDRPSFPCRRRRGEGRSAGGMQHSQDGSDRAREAGDTGVHGACLPVMRASAREERWRISFTSRSSLRLFSIHSR